MKGFTRGTARRLERLLRGDFQFVHDYQPAPDTLAAVCRVFARHVAPVDQHVRKGVGTAVPLPAETSWAVAEALEDLLNISLGTAYFGTPVAHPFVAAPAKATRDGPPGDPARLVKLRLAEGWATVVPKTGIGNAADGHCSALASRGDAYHPAFVRVDPIHFLSGERGSSKTVAEYLEFLEECQAAVRAAKTPVVASLLCGLPVAETRAEWDYSLDQLLRVADHVEVDFSPTTTPRPGDHDHDRGQDQGQDLPGLLDHYQRLVRRVETVLEVALPHARRHQARVLALKLPAQYRPILAPVVRRVRERERDLTIHGRVSLVCFNRAMGVLPDPTSFTPRPSAYGGDAAFLPNLACLHAHAAFLGNPPRVDVSYTGGITTGLRAAAVLATGSVTTIQVATALIFEGGALALFRLLGGYALYLAYLADRLAADHHVDVASTRALADSWRALLPPAGTTAGTTAVPGGRRQVAVVDPGRCQGRCQTTALVGGDLACPASRVCPSLAIRKQGAGAPVAIVAEACIGCGNCVEFCSRRALQLEPVSSR